MLILILIAFIVICITVDAVVRYSKQKKNKTIAIKTEPTRVFTENSLEIPRGIYFDKTHTWAFMEKNGTVKIGIDDFLVHTTGSFNQVRMKSPGEQIQKGESAVIINQNGKQLIINSPISGTIVSQNYELTENPRLVSTSPYNEGWVYSIEPSNWLRDTQFMIMSDIYKLWLKNEFTRLKDFLSVSNRGGNDTISPIMLQDGGELKDNILADFGPEVWEEFQIKFINTSKYISIVNILNHFNENSEYRLER